MEEIWKPIKGYEGIYEVSSYGRVRSSERTAERLDRYGNISKYEVKGRIISQWKRKDGYMSVTLRSMKTQSTLLVHRLVIETFVPNPDNLQLVNHKDENKSNNNVENLEWCTPSYNNTYNNIHMKKNMPFKKRVRQMTFDGEVIAEYESAADAARQTGLSNGGISSSCNGKKGFERYHGYNWEYI
jgi:NUMOD4 motif./HNH endonuclease.